MMVRKAGRWGILVALITLTLLVTGWLCLFYTEVGMADEISIGAQEFRLSESDYSAIPQPVIDDAARIAGEVVGNSQDGFQDLVDQLLATYVEAKDRDVVIVFNSGGWGGNMIEKTPGWNSIIDGIKSELEGLGYKSLVLNYKRTSQGLRACINEFMEGAARHPSKAKDLAGRVEFLTANVPNLRVIVTGESNGTVITDSTMSILRDNPRVYSIQTGTPFWHKPTALDRTLLMNSNGRTIDTFSYGNVPAVVWATVRNWFGLFSKEDNPGTVLSWLRAPGHDYSWQYPGVYSEVVKFLDENFGDKK
jgi:hypothetical protein